MVTTLNLQVEKLSRHIGAEVKGIDLNQTQDAATMAELKRLWLGHIVLLFRDQKLDQVAQLRATEFFGEVGYLARPANEYPAGYAKLLPNVMLISNMRENGEPIGALPDGEMMFHSDTPYVENPQKATILYAIEVPTGAAKRCFPTVTR